jgi:amino-acid N-acetyltransferase
MIPPGPIVALAYRIPDARRDALLAFLRDAVPLYERPGAIRVGLFESADEPGLFLELVAYATDAAYEADQVRVERDAGMVATLARFRETVGGPIEVRRMRPVEGIRAAAPCTVEPAAFNDGAAIAALLAAAGLPLPDDQDVPVRMLVVRDVGAARRVLGCVGWERHGEVALLRSLAVAAEARGRGLGLALGGAALAAIGAEGAREVVLLTTLATGSASIFEGSGFVRVERSALPEAVRGARQLASTGCASAFCLRRSLG